jgi:hypothetical protein
MGLERDEAATRLHCWVDAAYGSHIDGKGHTGYCFSLGQCIFYYRSFKQKNVTLSSCESENSAGVEAAKDLIWFKLLLLVSSSSLVDVKLVKHSFSSFFVAVKLFV